MNRNVLMEPYGVWVNHASADLNRYPDFALALIIYDKRARRHFRSPAYCNCFLKTDANCYLVELRILADSILEGDHNWPAGLSSCDGAPTPVRYVDLVELSSSVQAIHVPEAVEVECRWFNHYHASGVEVREITDSAEVGFLEHVTPLIGARPELSQSKEKVTEPHAGMRRGNAKMKVRLGLGTVNRAGFAGGSNA